MVCERLREDGYFPKNVHCAVAVRVAGTTGKQQSPKNHPASQKNLFRANVVAKHNIFQRKPQALQ